MVFHDNTSSSILATINLTFLSTSTLFRFDGRGKFYIVQHCDRNIFNDNCCPHEGRQGVDVCNVSTGCLRKLTFRRKRQNFCQSNTFSETPAIWLMCHVWRLKPCSDILDNLSLVYIYVHYFKVESILNIVQNPQVIILWSTSYWGFWGVKQISFFVKNVYLYLLLETNIKIHLLQIYRSKCKDFSHMSSHLYLSSIIEKCFFFILMIVSPLCSEFPSFV